MIANTAHVQTLSVKQASWLKDLFLVGMGSVLLALCAPLSFKLPFSPVPIALASHLVIFFGAVFGSRRGAIIVLAYLAQGAVGLPVFALGKMGLWHLLGPTGGYLFGYVAAAYLTGYLIEQMKERSNAKIFLALVAGNATIYFLGAFQLSFYIGLKSASILGVVPFLAGDVVKLWAVYRGIKVFNQ